MTEPAPPPLDEDLRALLRRAAAVEPAPPPARARVQARVEASVGIPGPPVAAPSPSAPRLPGLARRLFPLAVSFALGAGAGGLLVKKAMHAPAPAGPPRVVYVDRLVAAPPPAPPPREPEPLAPAASAARKVPTASPGPLQAERRLLDVARGALERGRPGAALDATSRHERAFPGGVLVQEREAMAIRALAQLGRGAEARARAARFRARFPDSVLWPAIESAIGSSPGP